MNKYLLAAILIFLAVILFISGVKFFSGPEDVWLCENGQWLAHGKPNVSMPTFGCGLVIATSTTNNTVTSPAMPEANIILSAPLASSTVSQVFTIAGQARVFESTLAIRLVLADNTKLFEKTVLAFAPDAGQFGLFYLNLDLGEYPAVKTGKLKIEALAYSAKDGREIDKTSVLVNYKPIKTSPGKTRLKIYLGNYQLNPNVNPCSAVFPVVREVDKTTAMGKAAIDALLDGPLEAEKLKKFYSAINPKTTLQKITIVEGVARVDFNSALSLASGACNVSLINAQIIETLKQFPTIKQVIISVNGQTEGILEP